MLKKFQHKVQQWGQSPWAGAILALLSFFEAFISPVSPLVLLIPMVMAQPKKAWHLALIATLASFIGALLGYYLGYQFMDLMKPHIIHWGYGEGLQLATNWFQRWGIGVLFVASLFPIPFKLFTIVAGSTKLPFLTYAVVAFIARWLHFALIPLAANFASSLLRRRIEQASAS